MHTEDNTDFSTDDVIAAGNELATITPAPEDAESDLQPFWTRRTVLKAAALGAAAAAFVNRVPGGLDVGVPDALANDLSNKPCTAGDVEIIGTGVIVNEPCNCTGTFNAQVQFTVRNNTGTGRYCIGLHLIPDGVIITQPLDLVLRDANGSSTAPGKDQGESFKDTPMFATIQNFPCGAGNVCFGQAGVVRGKCDPGTCTTISWNTSPGAAGCSAPDQNPPGGQCRHQQVCIQGRGTVTLDCDTSASGTQTNCSVTCGDSPTLRLCTTAPASFGPFQFKLDSGNYSSPTTDTCKDFTVGPLTAASTTFTGTVKDKDGCEKSATVTVTTTAITPTISVSGDTTCGDGILTYRASPPSGFSGCSVAWKIDGVAAVNTLTKLVYVNLKADGDLEYRNLDGQCHTITADVDCGGCKGTASKAVTQCVDSTVTNACGGASTTTTAAAPRRSDKNPDQPQGATQNTGTGQQADNDATGTKRRKNKKGKKGGKKGKKDNKSVRNEGGGGNGDNKRGRNDGGRNRN